MLGIIVGLLCLETLQVRAESGDIRIEAQLIWATNDKDDPNPKHKPVSSDIKEKLSQLPLKWSNYFEVNKEALQIPQGELRKAKLSEKCEVELKYLEGNKVEVALYNRGEPVLKRIQSLAKDEILVLGGNAPNRTAWLVALKRIK